MNILDFVEYDPRGYLVATKNHGRWKPGSRVGTLFPTIGYRCVKFLGSVYLEHRLIWQCVNGPIPQGFVIDHISGNPADNTIENLRLVSHSFNLRNAKLPRNNTSGHIGVYWSKSNKKWNAAVNDLDGNNINLGYFLTKEEAITARKNAEPLYGYHPNHGRKVQSS
jgi:hypothetical protein